MKTKTPFTGQINIKLTQEQEELITKSHDIAMLTALTAGLPAPLRLDFIRKTLFTALLAMVENAETKIK